MERMASRPGAAPGHNGFGDHSAQLVLRLAFNFPCANSGMIDSTRFARIPAQVPQGTNPLFFNLSLFGRAAQEESRLIIRFTEKNSPS